MYLVNGHHYKLEDRGFAEALAGAHAAHERPRCLCRGTGVAMYVARFGDDYGIKRMPYTGSQHAPDCPSYEPPIELSGAGGVLGSAVVEDPNSGLTTLRLAFALSRGGARAAGRADTAEVSSVATGEYGLGLRGLLHYLWDRAELTHWRPAFAGKRSWAVVRARLLSVAARSLARGEVLAGKLDLPEVFSVERRDEINERRMRQWGPAPGPPSARRRLMLLLGELKELAPSRYGFKAVIKHLPDHPFMLPERLYRKMERRFERELSLWGSSKASHLVMIATFDVNDAGVPSIEQLSLMLTSPQWIPVEDSFDEQLVQRLVNHGRRFIKTLGYNLPSCDRRYTAVLTDCNGQPTALRIVVGAKTDGEPAKHDPEYGASAIWSWHVNSETMPDLPAAGTPICGAAATASGVPHQTAPRE
ncbi:MAG: DUF1173 domain-containing protein [Caldimonas sp.]